MHGLARVFLAVSLLAAPRLLIAQERGAAALGEEVRGLGVTTRVLMIGAHPDDEDTPLLAWLARGERVETAYLSLTRGDGGQNLIGRELGPALGMIRTQELLAARRLDGARQYFTRAYDFGFSRNAEETFSQWDRELLLRDVVSVVRAFRPHVIVAVFSGTPRDGHGHHQVSGILAREAFDVAGDTVRLPSRATNGVGAWTPAKFYRAQRFRPDDATLRMNVGEYDPVLGRSYAEIAGESRSQHRSQAFGALQPKGVRWDYVRLEASRISDPAGAASERSLFDGVSGGWARFGALELPRAIRAAIDSLPAARAAVDRALDLRAPASAVAPLAAYVRLLRTAQDSLLGSADFRAPRRPCVAVYVPVCAGALGDLAVSLEVDLERAERALLNAAGVSVEALAPRPLVAAASDTLPVAVEVYNRGEVPVVLEGITVGGDETFTRTEATVPRTIQPDSVSTDTLHLWSARPTLAWWLAHPRSGAMFNPGDSHGDTLRGSPFGVRQLVRGEDRVRTTAAVVRLRIADAPVRAVVSPIVYRYADPSEGEVRRPVASVPAITVLLEREIEYAPAGRPIDRTVRVWLQSATTRVREVTVSLTLPEGLRADSVRRTLTLPPNGRASVPFRVRGTLRAGWSSISAQATSEGAEYRAGYVPVEYPHIAPQRYYGPAATHLSVVDVRVPTGLRVAYIPGAGDNTPPMLEQLGVPVTVIDTADIATADLSRFTTIVVGPRAYEASYALTAANRRILEFARRGGTVVVQYGQYEMTRPGIMPYPITIARPHDRVTREDAPVAILDSAAPLVRGPNRITAKDFDGWVQERALYMPRTFADQYTPLFEMHDPDEAPNRGAVLVAPVGRGTYVYTTLSFFRQLPAGVPGAARMFVNLLAAAPRE
jgi:LmbE family N-acetylglucosaminyl deacetylase